MAKRLQVLLEEDEYFGVKAAARRQGMSISEWVRQALRKAREDRPGTVDAKLRAIDDAARHQFPTSDIETMLREIQHGQRMTASH